MAVKKGFTLIELLVGMAIFLVVSTMIVGSFVTVVRLKSMVSIMRESQEKLRTDNELISRLSRQAELANTTNCDAGTGNCEVLRLFYNTNDSTKYNGVKFVIDPSSQQLLYFECSTQSGCINGSWSPANGSSLSSGSFKLDTSISNSYFHINAGKLPAELDFKLKGNINGISGPFYSDTFTLDNAVTLENIIW